MTEAALLGTLRQLYASLDGAVADFSRSTGLRCPSGCGECCENPTIHSTALECLLLAAAALDEGRIDDLKPGVCVFYQSHGPGRGRCRRYEDRPLLCRLFGFASRRDGHGTSHLDRCRVHRTEFPAAFEAAGKQADRAPRYTEWSMQVRGILPASLQEEQPINLAVKAAAEFLYWKRRSQSESDEES